ncbi:MAG: hypothetical protein R3C49_03200 [Planctomycetaceae bacterium]
MRTEIWSNRSGVVATVLICLLAVAAETEAAQSRSRRRSNAAYARRAAAAAKAQREAMIKGIQAEVSRAKDVLQKVESQGNMTATQLREASSRLDGIREQIDGHRHDAREASKTLHSIEQEILAEQEDSSEFGKAQKAAMEARRELHLTFHRVTGLPEADPDDDSDDRLLDLQKLTDAQRDQLHADEHYQAAERRVKEASAQVTALRRKLFQEDPDWMAAHDDLQEAKRLQSDEEKEQRRAGARAFEKKQDLIEAKTIAANARSIIANAEARLRRLGASAKPTPSTKSSGSGNDNTPRKPQ